MLKPSDWSKWKVQYKKLLTFYIKEGHSRVAYRGHDPALGRWVSKQRLAYNNGKLNEKQIELLEKVNFVWSRDIRKENDKAFTLMFRQLKKFKEEHGHCRVPNNRIKYPKLGRWVEVIRDLEKNNLLPDWKKMKLDDIGFAWSAEVQRSLKLHWYEMFRRLEGFKDKYGHCNVPEGYKNDSKLWVWVCAQRRPKKPLSPSKKALLISLGFSFNLGAELKRKRNPQGRFTNELEVL